MPSIDTQGPRRSRKRPATRRTPPRPAPADTKGASEFRKAERYKRTPAYRRQVGQTYSEQSPRRKAQIRRATAGRKDLTSRAIQERAQRESREVRDVKSQADLGRARPTRRRSGGLFGTGILGTGEFYIGREKLSEDDPRHPYHAMKVKVERARAKKLAPALSILEQTTRPVHAIAAGTRAGIRGKNVPRAVSRGAQLKDKSLFSDVLKDLGAPKLVQSVGGFALDVGLDPTTYVTGGTAAVGRKAAEKAGRKATKRALKAGASQKAANRAGRSAAGKAMRRESNTGLTVGVGRHRTSGRGTAALARKARVPQAAERARGALPGRLVRHVNPNLRPPGVSVQEWKRVRSASRRGRAQAAAGERQARNRAVALNRALKGAEHPHINDALESRDLSKLTPKERDAARFLQREYDEMYRAENAGGLVGRKFREFGYSPRRPLSELEPSTKKRRAMSGAQLASSKTRTNRKPRAEFRGSEADVYTENVPLSYYLRARESAVKQGRKHVIDELHGVGRRFHAGAEVREGDAIYKFAPRKDPVEVEGDELKSLFAGGAPAGQAEYRVLNRELVKRSVGSGPEKLEDLEEIGRLWDRNIQGKIKTILTVPNPQYHATNLYGDLFNAYLGSNVPALARNLGISARALTYKARREAAAKTLGKQIDPKGHGVKVGDKRVGMDEVIKRAEDAGAIGQGFIGRDLPEVLEAQGKEAAEKLGQGRIAKRTGKVGQKVAASRVGSRALHPIDAIRDVGQYREDAVRLATFVGALKRGMSDDEAAAYVARHHFDYGDLTTFERSIARRVMPFYTFTARNVPLQARTLVSKPGKYANVEKAREELSKAGGMPEDYEAQLKEFEQRGVPFPIPGVKVGDKPALLFPKLPVTDLNRLGARGQGDALISMISPILKTPLELHTNYSFFFKDKIDKLVGEEGPSGEKVRQLKPAPKWLVGSLPDWAREGLHIREYTDPKTKKRVWGWPAKLDHAFASLGPAAQVAAQMGVDIRNTRGQSAGNKLFGYGTGLKVQPFDAGEVSERKLFGRRGFLEAKAKAMRQQGDAYVKGGAQTPAYRKVLAETRKLDRQAEMIKRKQGGLPAAGGLSPGEVEKLLRGAQGSDGGGGLDPEEIQKLLRGTSP